MNPLGSRAQIGGALGRTRGGCSPIVEFATMNAFQSYNVGTPNFVFAADLVQANARFFARYLTLSPGTLTDVAWNVSNGIGSIRIQSNGSIIFTSTSISGFLGSFRLAFYCNGSDVRLYRNRVLIRSITDNTNLNLTSVFTSVQISNAKVWPISCAAEECNL